MDGVAIMRAALLAHDPITALVADRIVAGDVPQDMQLPAVGITEVSRTEPDTVARSGPSMVTARIQVTVHATSYPQQKELIKAAGLGRGAYAGAIAGAQVKSILRDVVGPDMGNRAAGIFEQPRDFKVTYLEQD